MEDSCHLICGFLLPLNHSRVSFLTLYQFKTGDSKMGEWNSWVSGECELHCGVAHNDTEA